MLSKESSFFKKIRLSQSPADNMTDITSIQNIQCDQIRPQKASFMLRLNHCFSSMLLSQPQMFHSSRRNMVCLSYKRGEWEISWFRSVCKHNFSYSSGGQCFIILCLLFSQFSNFFFFLFVLTVDTRKRTCLRR